MRGEGNELKDFSLDLVGRDAGARSQNLEADMPDEMAELDADGVTILSDEDREVLDERLDVTNGQQEPRREGKSRQNRRDRDDKLSNKPKGEFKDGKKNQQNKRKEKRERRKEKLAMEKASNGKEPSKAPAPKRAQNDWKEQLERAMEKATGNIEV